MKKRAINRLLTTMLTTTMLVCQMVPMSVLAADGDDFGDAEIICYADEDFDEWDDEGDFEDIFEKEFEDEYDNDTGKGVEYFEDESMHGGEDIEDETEDVPIVYETADKNGDDCITLSEINSRFEFLQGYYPQGRYWNHNQTGSYYNGVVSDTPCPDEKGDHNLSGGDHRYCNAYAGAIQCMGFGYLICAELFGSAPSVAFQ